MSKDFKEKYEKVCNIKDKALTLVEAQINGDISSVDAKELGEVADIAKDMAETMMLCAEAEYYHKVTEAMDEASEEDKSHYLNKYIPEYEGKFFTPVEYTRPRKPSGVYMYTEPVMYDPRMDEGFRDRMYYTEPSSMNRDMREGRSGMSRRMYMENKDNPDATVKMQNLDTYMHDLTDDLMEMVQNMSTQEKAQLKQKLTTLASKVA